MNKKTNERTLQNTTQQTEKLKQKPVTKKKKIRETGRCGHRSQSIVKFTHTNTYIEYIFIYRIKVRRNRHTNTCCLT